MFWKKILFLAAWYVAGNVVSSVYSSQKKKAKKTQWKEDVKMMAQNFLDTQKNFIADIESKYLTEDNKQKLSEKKKEFLKHAEKYTKEGQKLLEEIGKNEKIIAGKKKAWNVSEDLFVKWKAFLAELFGNDETDVKKKK